MCFKKYICVNRDWYNEEVYPKAHLKAIKIWIIVHIFKNCILIGIWARMIKCNKPDSEQD